MAQGTLQVSADTRGDEKPLDQGTLTLIDNQIDQSTGTIRLKATFPNKANTLWPGQFVDAKLLLRTQHDAITVPGTAVQRSQDGLYVYTVKPDGTVDTKTVDVDRIADGVAVIKQGLNAGDRVVTAGQYRLQPGTHVQIRQAATPAQPAATTPGA
jgi:multidrug efflux system membrane fusion protein